MRSRLAAAANLLFKNGLQFFFMTKKKEDHGMQGMTFGAMDAIINVLGIVVGLGVMGNKVAVVVGLVVAGLANSMGNAAGFHVSEETEGVHTRREVWFSTILSFCSTFFVTIILLLPLLLLSLANAIVASVSMGITIMIFLALFVGRRLGHGRKDGVKLVLEYVAMGVIVVIAAFYLGQVASSMLGGLAA